jgi:hypothetical protein
MTVSRGEATGLRWKKPITEIIEEVVCMLQPENQTKKYEALFSNINEGRIKIPQFQRDFVWGKEQTAQLIDSIIKGFPIGTFILWKTQEELRHIKNIGNVSLPDVPKGESVQYILDGQQRITSLYAVWKGLRITIDGDEVDYKDISIDLSKEINADERVVVVEPPEDTPHISVHKLLNGSITELVDQYRDELSKIEVYKARLTGYDFSTIMISNYPIDIACEIFTRINTGGTELTLFEIMVAKTYDLERDFDLAREFDWLIDNKGAEKDLEDVGYDTVASATVLQCIAVSTNEEKQVRRRDILKLNKNDFINKWPTVKDGIFAAVDYLRSYQRIPVSRLLPYNALLVPLTYFSVQNNYEPPSPSQDVLLTQYLYWAALTNRFSSGVEGKIALDIKKMDRIIAEEAPDYQREELQLTMDDLRWRWFRTGDAFCKAILCLYAFHRPLSFAANNVVNIDNSWLRQSYSKNYHHFFPRAYLKRQGVPDWQANVILNITFVDDYLNKRKIGQKSPSNYLQEFADKNDDLENTLKTHLIKANDGIWNDDYPSFIEARGEWVLSELNSRLNPS